MLNVWQPEASAAEIETTERNATRFVAFMGQGLAFASMKALIDNPSPEIDRSNGLPSCGSHSALASVSKKPPKSVEERIPKPVTPTTGGISRNNRGSNCRHKRRPSLVEYLPPNPATNSAAEDQAPPEMRLEVVFAILVPMGCIHHPNCCPGELRTLV